MNTLYVQGHRARVGLQKDSLIVSDPGAGFKRVPLAALEAVVMLGHGQITSDALAKCAERNVRVSSLQRGGKVRFVVGGPTSGNVHLRVAQLRAFDDPTRRITIARTIVAGKLQNYRLLLRRWSWDARGPDRDALETLHERVTDRLGALPSVDTGDAIRGIEGDATRWYLKGLGVHLGTESPAFRYSLRSRRPPRDAMNALLSFTYALLLSEIVGALDAVGLDPQIGYLHGVRSGRPSLALDLLEEFRPAVADRFAVRLVKLRILRDPHFVSTLGGGCYLTEEGRRTLIKEYESHKDEVVPHRLLGRPVYRWTLPQIQATLMARHIRGDLPSYAPYLMEP